MNLLDMRTVFLSSVVSTAICAIIMAELWRQNRRRFPGLGFWVADFVLQCLAIVVIDLRPALPETVSILLGVPLFLGGTLLLYIGLERYLGKTSAQRPNGILLALFFLGHVYFSVVQPSLQARNINFSAGLIVLVLQCAWLLLRRVDAATRPTTKMVGLVFCIYALVSAARIGVDLLVPPGNDVFQSGLYDTLALLAYQMLFIALTLALVLMVNRRLTTELEQDILERRRAEADLRHSEEKFSLAFKTSPYAIIITRLADGKIIEVNDAFTVMTGFTRAEALASSTVELALWANPEDRQAVVAELRRGQDILVREYRFKTKTGAVITGLFSCCRLALEGAPCALSSINDITGHRLADEKLRVTQLETERLLAEAQESRRALLGVVEDQKEAEAEREKIQSQLVQAQKLESVGRLAGGVAHDFNNMLQCILGHAELMKMKGLPSADLEADLEEIRKAAQRSADLTRQLLGFARKQTIMPKVIDINQTVEGLLTMLRRLLGEDIKLVWQPAPERMMVNMDPAQIDQIMVNLIINARDAMTGGGHILLETQRGHLPAGFALASAPDVDYALLSVTDYGCGMTPEVQAQILEPFFTTKPMGKGTGLGLPMVYGIVKQNKGELTFTSELGKGSTFTVCLPLLPNGAAELPELKHPSDSPGGRESILVVEDEPGIRLTLVRLLSSLGYTAWPADSQPHALDMLKKNELNIALLITDVVMPGMTGGELVNQAKDLCPTLKYLHISGYPDDDLARRGILDKRIRFLSKPFTRDQLAHKVREALGGG